jgi:hypothetical protein
MWALPQVDTGTRFAPILGYRGTHRQSTLDRRHPQGFAYVGPPLAARFRHRAALSTLRRCVSVATRPAAPLLIAGALADLIRTKPELVAENALLRQ